MKVNHTILYFKENKEINSCFDDFVDVPSDDKKEILCELLKKTKYRKYFRLALHGWMEYHIAAVETSTTSFLSNPAGRNARKTLELNFRPKAK